MYKLRKVLLLECKKVLCSDPFVPDAELTPLAEVLDQADLLVIGTPHDCYKDLACRQPIVDVTATIKVQLATWHRKIKWSPRRAAINAQFEPRLPLVALQMTAKPQAAIT